MARRNSPSFRLARRAPMSTAAHASSRGARTPKVVAAALARRGVSVIGGIIAVGAILRFSTLDAQSFDYDELVTVWLLKKPFGEMLSLVPNTESTPPLYYILAWGWG